MRDALLSLGYSVSPPILDCLLSKYDKSGKGKAMDYDSFVEYVLFFGSFNYAKFAYPHADYCFLSFFCFSLVFCFPDVG